MSPNVPGHVENRLGGNNLLRDVTELAELGKDPGVFVQSGIGRGFAKLENRPGLLMGSIDSILQECRFLMHCPGAGSLPRLFRLL